VANEDHARKHRLRIAEIQRKTRRQFSAEEKIRIVLEDQQPAGTFTMNRWLSAEGW